MPDLMMAEPPSITLIMAHAEQTARHCAVAGSVRIFHSPHNRLNPEPIVYGSNHPGDRPLLVGCRFIPLLQHIRSTVLQSLISTEIVQRQPGSQPDRQPRRNALQGRVPDACVVHEALPHSATATIDKRALRHQYAEAHWNELLA
ncbi:hypothetical protein [Pseudomonas sp. 5P_3.1_Bac2]|uniref:hypothetical protein n=1 Tax=Pseudomonas sp. 5P_3.1_Bac2 TaxID=2971617 RepID=UPI0021C66E7F|nr:hypothetical protein [Pseudomonas sp. 5P_3.1_Bac2]MCU1715685.1 hypothetical protein [Pseudomonas sp. 5P_3.1_Bac2]